MAKITKDTAWEEWLKTLQMEGQDVEDPNVTIDDCCDAFNYGWDMAMKSLELPMSVVPCKSIIGRMNEILGRKFGNKVSTQKIILARWREGKREQDFEDVCIIKQAQWKDDPKLAVYLRPETLFGTKMDSYLNEPMPKKKKTIRNQLGMLIEVDDE